MPFRDRLRPVPETAVFDLPDRCVWGGTMAQSDDGVCHLLFSCWPKSRGFQAWVTHSEIGHATADHPLGPYRFRDIVVAGRGGGGWDADVIHNPNMIRHEGRYYLYYNGNKGSGDWWEHRNNQRVGVAVADHPAGPWERFDEPLLDVRPGKWDALITTNPACTPTPDGRFLLIYKTVGEGPMPFGGQVVHGIAISDSPTGPFERYPYPVFTSGTEKFPAEDPCAWCENGLFHAIVKDQHGSFTGKGLSLAHFTSADGIQWEPARDPFVTTPEIQWRNGNTESIKRLERPQVWRRNGMPAVLFCAAMREGEDDDSFNVHIPLQGLEESDDGGTA